MSFSWLLPPDGLQFIFLLHDSENDLYNDLHIWHYHKALLSSVGAAYFVPRIICAALSLEAFAHRKF